MNLENQKHFIPTVLCLVLLLVRNTSFPLGYSYMLLLGMLFLGVTGMKAAISHAPYEDGRQRYAFFAFPHIGISDRGTLGEVTSR